MAKSNKVGSSYIAGNTFEDRLDLTIRESALRIGIERNADNINKQFNNIHASLQRQGVEIYCHMLQNPPLSVRPLLVCYHCLLLWSPVFDPAKPLPFDIGMCPNGCNKDKINLKTQHQ